jgi:hypothetical protein
LVELRNALQTALDLDFDLIRRAIADVRRAVETELRLRRPKVVK